jgi:hypothetical protein
VKEWIAGWGGCIGHVRRKEEVNAKPVFVVNDANRPRLQMAAVGFRHRRAGPARVARKFRLQRLLDAAFIAKRGQQGGGSRRVTKLHETGTDKRPRLPNRLAAEIYVEDDLSGADQIVEM